MDREVKCSASRLFPKGDTRRWQPVTQGKDHGNSITAERGVQDGPKHGSGEWGEIFRIFTVAGGTVGVEGGAGGERRRAQQSQKGIFSATEGGDIVEHRGRGPSGESWGATFTILMQWDPTTLPYTQHVT